MSKLNDILKVKNHLLNLELFSRNKGNEKITVYWNDNKVEVSNKEIKDLSKEFDEKYKNILNQN